MDPFTLAAYLALVVGLVAGAFFFAAARKRGAAAGLAFAGAAVFFAGLLMSVLISMHLGSIIGRALMGKGVSGEAHFTYNFRFYSLLLLGMLVGASAVTCMVHAPRVARGEKSSWKLVLRVQFFLMAILLPLLPIQPGLAIGLSTFSLVNVISLWLTRSRLTQ